jgi:hypothetical protein
MDRLDTLIDNLTDKIAKYKDITVISESNQKILDYLIELKQLRRSQIQPAVKFLGNGINKQFAHMDSEMDEILKEYFYGEPTDHDKLAMEIIDLQFSCQTMLEGPLGLTKDQIADYVQMVVKKNADRGYDKK